MAPAMHIEKGPEDFIFTRVMMANRYQARMTKAKGIN
jgi:hypothetical protein